MISTAPLLDQTGIVSILSLRFWSLQYPKQSHPSSNSSSDRTDNPLDPYSHLYANQYHESQKRFIVIHSPYTTVQAICFHIDFAEWTARSCLVTCYGARESRSNSASAPWKHIAH